MIDDPHDFIDRAIARGSSSGIAQLSPTERMVFLISEAEVLCDMEGIDSFLDCYGADGIRSLADAYAAIGALEIVAVLRKLGPGPPERTDPLLDVANSLISARAGYGYEDIVRAVERSE